MQLTFRGPQIAATLDGKSLATVHDATHKSGMIAFGTDWGRAQFDNLSVQP
jgi:hypothetical protein